MRITALLENSSCLPEIESRHGLSLHIETENHSILFDLGPDETTLRNAGRLGIDLGGVDTVVISHGHSDHGGALAAFLKINGSARVYVHESAFEPHYSRRSWGEESIGLDRELLGCPQLVLTGESFRIDEGLLLFSDVQGQFLSQGNAALLKREGERLVQDDFTHEQSLIITEKGKNLLLTGCSHRGILNILAAAGEHCDRLDTVIGGFHLTNPSAGRAEPMETLLSVADGLRRSPARLYTCHCTGKEAFAALKSELGEQLEYLAAGARLSL